MAKKKYTRPLIRNTRGGVSSELSITVTTPKLNKGRPTNIPSIWGGKERSEAEAVKRALGTKKKYRSYKSISEAVGAAKKRSKKIGQERKKEIKTFKRKK